MYTPKLDELINLVDNFSKKHNASPTNGIGFSTNSFKENYFATKSETFKVIYGEKPKDVYEDLDSNFMASKTFNLVIKNKDFNIIPLIKKLDGYIHPSQTYLISFIESQEDLILNKTKLKM